MVVDEDVFVGLENERDEGCGDDGGYGAGEWWGGCGFEGRDEGGGEEGCDMGGEGRRGEGVVVGWREGVAVAGGRGADAEG